MATQHFKVQNLNCPSCITHLEAMEDDLPGVTKVDASYKQQAMKVEFDETAQTTEGIMAAVSEMGYIAIPHQPSADDTQADRSLWQRIFR